jgi:hypothetical protein
LERIIRTKMTKVHMHHKNSGSERFLLPKNEGGVGITDIHSLHNTQVKSLRHYFHKKTNNSHHIKLYVTHRLITHLLIYMILSHNKMKTSEQYKNRTLHGGTCLSPRKANVNKTALNAWLKVG